MEANSISYHCLETRVDKWNDYDVNNILKIRDTKICLLAEKKQRKDLLMPNGEWFNLGLWERPCCYNKTHVI